MNEFELIARHLAPLAGEGAFGLTDDAALHHDMVMTKDLLVDGVHFRTADGWDAAAQKALRTNISDIVAKGAQPDGVLLGMVWPRDVTEDQITSFCEGLSADIRAYGLNLLGGDTTRHGEAGGPLTISVTLTGRPGARGPILRSGAVPGDILMVTGVIGDGWLGLQSKLGKAGPFGAAERAYLCPEPPAVLAGAIGQYASAALDVSDGLVADAGHMAKASNAAIEISADAVPLSAEAQTWVSGGGDIAHLLTGGDDYQTLMAVRPENAEALHREARGLGIALAEIGRVLMGNAGVNLLAPDGVPLATPSGGYSHF